MDEYLPSTQYVQEYDRGYGANDTVEDADDNSDSDSEEVGKWYGYKIAFMSHLSSDKNKLGLGQHIKFDSVTLNDGDCYDKHTGVFT